MNESFKDSMLDFSNPAYERVTKIAKRIVDSNQDVELLRNQHWKIYIIDSAELNAMVLPNGSIYVFSGLLKQVGFGDELAFVLSHEMAHAILKHSVNLFKSIYHAN